MECNKEDASKAKDIAEQKLKDKDFASAKRLALKAQRLYPALDGIKQLLDTLEVYISAEPKTNGGVDWYRVLGVERSADDDMIRKQYLKLVLSLHPDKNKSVGADGAFKIVSEAWGLLSDKKMRLEYNRRLNMSDTQARTSDQTPPVPTGQNGNHTVFNNIQPQASCGASHAGPVPASVPSEFNTFWTLCSYCKQYFRLHRSCLNQYAPCLSCHQPYFTIEMPPPPSYVQGFHSSQHQRNKNPCAAGSSQSVHMQGVNVSHSRATESSNAAGTKADQPSNIRGVSSMKHKRDTGALRDAYEREVVMGLASPKSGIGQRVRGTVSSAAETGRLKKKHGVVTATDKEGPHKKSHVLNGTSTAAGSATVSSQSGTCSASKEDKPSEKRSTNKQRKNNLVNGTWKQMENGVEKVAQISKCIGRGTAKQVENKFADIAKGSPQKGTGRGAVNKTEDGGKVSQSSSTKGGLYTRVNNAGNNRSDVMPLFSQTQINEILKKRAEIMITNKLKEWGGLAALTKALEKDAERKESKQKPTPNGMKLKLKQHPESVAAKKGIDPSKSPVASTEHPSVEGKVMSVSDPDFHNFDWDRVEKSFGKSQVWAAYDDDDGMPRLYVMIHEVETFLPFRLQISWLNSKNNQEFSPLNWVGSGFPKTSGEYWIGKRALFKSLNSFSHKVNGWIKGKKGVIQIYPSKGDVWALYRNWSPDWNESTPDEVVHRYDMVEVLEDYEKDEGVTVALLIKVAGFRTVFRRHPDQSRYWAIPREEMFRFSHQVPSHLLTGNEGRDAPAGCLELDPAAMSLELLQVITNVQEEEMVAHIEKASGERPNRPIKKSGEEHLSNNVRPLEEDVQEAEETRKRKGKEIEEQVLPASKRRR